MFFQISKEKEECIERNLESVRQREALLRDQSQTMQQWVEKRLAVHDPALPPTLKRTLGRGIGSARKDPVTGLYPLTR